MEILIKTMKNALFHPDILFHDVFRFMYFCLTVKVRHQIIYMNGGNVNRSPDRSSILSQYELNIKKLYPHPPNLKMHCPQKWMRDCMLVGVCFANILHIQNAI